MLTQADLNRFTGTEAYYRWSALYPNFVLTDGAKYVAEEGKAYWLMDVIASWQAEPKVNKERFQVWILTVDDGARAEVVAEDGNGHVLALQMIGYTDFPLQQIKLYASYRGWHQDDRYMVILLPSEY
jgi:hypothetical protein